MYHKKFLVALTIILIGILSVEAAYGQEINIEYTGGTQWTGTVTAQGLKPDTPYMLTLNGKIGHPSNNLLMQKYETYQGNEGFCNFKRIKSNDNGEFSTDFSVGLLCGDYNAKFLVKDIEDNWNVVYADDYLQFIIICPEGQICQNGICIEDGILQPWLRWILENIILVLVLGIIAGIIVWLIMKKLKKYLKEK